MTARTGAISLPVLAIQRLFAPTYIRYLAASVVALGIDAATYLAALEAGTRPTPAAILGYCVGIAVHWQLSNRLVFGRGEDRFARSRGDRRSLFVGSALVGLALTAAIVAGTTDLGLDPRLAKLVAIVISFQATYLMRKIVVFR